jgi:glyoxylase-like metal-dependent hydrolase (beta-lactamase superfamily II)
MQVSRDERYAWAQPRAEDLGNGLFRFPLPLPNDGLRAVNVYAIADGEGFTLIDGGWAIRESRRLLAEYLGAYGAGLGDIRQFLVTHVHRDHYSQAIAVRETHGATVAIGRGEMANITALNKVAMGLMRPTYLRRLHRAGASRLADLGALEGTAQIREDLTASPDRWLSDGTTIQLASRDLEVIATPGHTRGHVVFHDANARVLFAGDHVLPHITPSVGFEPAPVTSSLGDYLTSLARVRALPDSRLLPAHGPVVKGTHDRVDELLRHHDRRLNAMRAAVAAGATTAYDVACAVKWTWRESDFTNLRESDQILAVLESEAHLDLLIAQGRLDQTTPDGVVFYQIPSLAQGGAAGAPGRLSSIATTETKKLGQAEST